MQCINPYTGRNIRIGSKTYNTIKLRLKNEGLTRAQINKILSPYEQHGGANTAPTMPQKSGMFENLVQKAQSMGSQTQTENQSGPEIRLVSQGSGYKKEPVIPDSKYHLLNSNRPPNPTEHSWYHYHAPFSQNFGDYVCVKRSTLRDFGTFIKDAFVSDMNAGSVK
jgi:hypothetical protein